MSSLIDIGIDHHTAQHRSEPRAAETAPLGFRSPVAQEAVVEELLFTIRDAFAFILQDNDAPLGVLLQQSSPTSGGTSCGGSRPRAARGFESLSAAFAAILRDFAIVEFLHLKRHSLQTKLGRRQDRLVRSLMEKDEVIIQSHSERCAVARCLSQGWHYWQSPHIEPPAPESSSDDDDLSVECSYETAAPPSSSSSAAFTSVSSGGERKLSAEPRRKSRPIDKRCRQRRQPLRIPFEPHCTEFILRYLPPQPSTMGGNAHANGMGTADNKQCSSAQRMYVSIMPDEFRVAGVFTECLSAASTGWLPSGS